MVSLAIVMTIGIRSTTPTPKKTGMPTRRAVASRVHGVHFLGFRNQSELPALYAAADVLCLPSVRETFGLVVSEAMHAGLPVVCSDRVGCTEDLVLPGQTGAVFYYKATHYNASTGLESAATSARTSRLSVGIFSAEVF